MHRIPLLPMLAGWFLLSVPAILFAQADESRRRWFSEQEMPGDPRMPIPSYQVQPAYHYRQGTGKRNTSSGITTVQVNVDSSGNDLIGDAANEPSLAVDSANPNRIVAGWRQFDNVLSNFRQAGNAWSADSGMHWTPNLPIQAGIFRSDPVLDHDLSGNFYYNSLTLDSTSGQFLCKVFISRDSGRTWDNGTPAQGGDKQWMTIDRTAGPGSGNIYSFWSSFASSCNPDNFTRSTDGGTTYEPCTFVNGDPYLGTMTTGAGGEVYVSGASASQGYVHVSVSSQANQAANPVSFQLSNDVFLDGDINYQPSINPDGILGQTNVETDRSGNQHVFVLASVYRNSLNDPGDVMFARSTDGGQTWELPVRINDDISVTNTQWFGTLSVAPNGRIDVVWLDTRDGNGTDSSALYYSFSNDLGVTWSVNEKLSPLFDPHTGYPNQLKMGDYFDLESDNEGAHLIWTATFNGGEDIYHSRILPPLLSGQSNVPSVISFRAYPNPCPETLMVTTPLSDGELSIHDMKGTVILTRRMASTSMRIPVAHLPAGVYSVSMIQPDGLRCFTRFIKP